MIPVHPFDIWPDLVFASCFHFIPAIFLTFIPLMKIPLFASCFHLILPTFVVPIDQMMKIPLFAPCYQVHPSNTRCPYCPNDEHTICLHHPSNICCPYCPNDEHPICLHHFISSSSFQHLLSLLSKWWTSHLFASYYQVHPSNVLLSLLSKWWTSLYLRAFICIIFSAHASNIVIPFDLDNENPLCLHHGFHLIFPTSFSPFYRDDKNLPFCIIYIFSSSLHHFSGLLHHVELLLPAIHSFCSMEDPFFASCSAHRELHFCFRRRINPSYNEEAIMLNKRAHLGRQAGRPHGWIVGSCEKKGAFWERRHNVA